jgi:hypothetical protein
MFNNFLRHYRITPQNIHHHGQQRIHYFRFDVSYFIVLVGACDLKAWIDKSYKKVSIDIYKNSQKSNDHTYNLDSVNGDSINIVVDGKYEDRSGDDDGVDEWKRKYEVHGSVE